MQAQGKFGRLIVVGLMAFVLAGCASSYDRRANNTMIGAGLGAATGAVISGGDPLYAIGGAAAGGLLGNILTQDRSYRSRDSYRDRDYRRSRDDDRRWNRRNDRHHRH
ncbi:hypothetical protein PT7_3652 [Pusillimonas sp. T7-7]|uniref:hypothetical protein n=1 Tax=Pusillimonas sp. (strain T7-7) TaxID=1007105 RepID=UPI0002084922|nr:hypothetical protein [Pusillimonas sp. T7-7]AEC22192.1 hypothetical protein PT7_3652 [Pusillimonas sp. T7-7]